MVFLLACLAIVVLGLVGYRVERARLFHAAEGELAFQATLQRDRLDRFLGARLANAALEAQDPYLRAWAQAHGPRADLVPWLRELARADHFQSVGILDTDGQILASSEPIAFTEADLAAIRSAHPQVGPRLIWDLDNMHAPPAPRIACLAPFPGGLLWARLDAAALLHHVNRNPPAYRASLETFILVQQGATRAALNPSRIQPGPLPDAGMDRRELVGVQALLGGEGPYSGVDYRNVPVLAFGRKSTRLPWTLLAKVDRSEVTAELARLAWAYAGLGTLFLAGILAVFSVWWRKHQALHHALAARSDAERQLLDQQFRALSRHANDMVLLLDAEGRILDANDRACEAYGYPREQLLRLAIKDLRPLDTSGVFENQFDEVKEHFSARFETIHVRKDGSFFPVDVSSRAFIHQGSILVQSILRDITERKAAEQALVESERRFRQLLIEIPQMAVMLDAEGRITFCNACFRQRTGWTEDEVLGKSWFRTCIPEAQRPRIEGVFREALRSGGIPPVFENPVMARDGRMLDVAWSNTALKDTEGRMLGLASLGVDVTAQRAAERTLKESEARLRLATEGARMAVWEYDFRTNTMARSANHDGLYGLEPQPEWNIRAFLRATCPEDREVSNACILAAVAPGGPDHYAFDFRTVHPDDSLHWLRVTGEVVARDEKGCGIMARGTLQDITAQREAEKDLRVVSLAMEQSPVSVILTDPAGAILHVNPAFCRVTGYTREEAMGQNPRILKSGKQDHAFYKALWDTLLAGQPWSGELVNRKKDGTLYTERAVISPVHDGNGSLLGYVAVKEDTTELKAQERQITRMNRLYAAMVQFNQAMVRMAEEQDLLDSICHILVEVGGFALAWIGWDDPATHEVTMAARSADPHGYLEGLQIRSDDTPEGRGPTGTCLREGHPVLVDDFRDSSLMAPWRERALQAGFASTATFPIRMAGRVAATLSVYGAEPAFFGPEETALLEGAAEDLAFALETMAAEAGQARLVHMLDASRNEIYSLRGDTLEITYANLGALTALGRPRNEVLGRKPWDLNADRSEAAIRERLGQLLREGPDELVLETRHRRGDGSSYPVEIHIQAFAASDRVDFLAVATDISERQRMTRDLIESQSTLAALVESTPDMIWTVDPVHFGILNFNTSLRDYFQVHRGLSITPGMRPSDLFPPGSYVQQWEDYYRIALTQGTFEVEYTAFSGTRTLLLRFSLLRRDGGVFGISVFGRDITDRKNAELALQRNEAWLNTIFAAMNEGFSIQDVICDDQGRPRDLRFVAANPAFERQTGLTNEATLGHTLLELFPDAEPAWIQRYGQVGLTGESTQFEAPFGPLGKFYTVSAFQITPGQFGVLFSDISDRKRAEEQLQRMNEELETRVAQRTAQLESANRELEAFSYSVSHDLRAPLRGMDGFARAMEEDYAARLDDEGRRYLGRIRTAAQRMGQLIDDLLKLSRVSRGEFECIPLDLGVQARAIFGTLAESDPDRNVHLDLAPDLWAEGDPRLLGIVLENLLGNAWKYTRKRPEAHLVLGALDQPGPRVFYVRDDGAGFDMAYADKLFQPFQRLHSPKDFEGSGIGLAIVQRIIHRHGGRIWAEASPGEGATIYFTLEGGAA